MSTTGDVSTGTVAQDRGIVGLALGFAAFAALGLVVPFLILARADQGRSVGWVVTLVILLMSATRLSVLVSRGERRLFEFIFWLFCYVFFGLAPTVQMRLDQMPTTTPDLDPFLDLPTALLALVGVLAIAGGFAYSNRVVREHEKLLDFDISVVRLVLLSALGLLFAAYYALKVGPGTLFSSRAASSEIEDQLWPDPSVASIVRAGSSFPVLIAAHAWWNVAARRSRKGGARVIAAVLTVVSLLITNPISSSRYGSGVVWGSFLGVLGGFRTRRRTSVSMLGIVAGLLFVFPVADYFRRVTQVSVSRGGFLAEYAGNGDYDAFGQLSNALLYDRTMPLQFGRQLLGLAFFWVPRSIWSDKPVGSGVVLAQFRGYDFTNLSAPIWAEMLLNFGIIGVVVASFLVGNLLGRLDQAFRGAGGGGPVDIAAAVLPFYLLILLRGSLLQATGTLFVIIASLVLVAGRRRTPQEDPL